MYFMIHKRSGKRHELDKTTFDALSVNRAYKANFRFEIIDVHPEITKLTPDEILKKVEQPKDEAKPMAKKAKTTK